MMLSATARTLVQLQPPQFTSESSFNLPPMSTSSFRLPRVAPVSAAYSTATAGESRRTTSTSTCVRPPALAAPSSFYEVLGIPMGATNNEIKAAYRRLARVYHPDVAAIDEKSSSADEFMKVHAAYSTLSDPDKRADYDRGLFRNFRGVRLYSSPSPKMSRYSGYSGRNWETDQCW